MKTDSPQSLAGAVRQRLATIEERIQHGVRLEVIRRELEAEGFATTAISLRNALYRARARKRTLSAAPTGEKAARGANPGRSPAGASVNSAPARSMPLPNPLFEPRGFVYHGTQGISKEDLI